MNPAFLFFFSIKLKYPYFHTFFSMITTLKHYLLKPIAAAGLASAIASCQYAKADSAIDYSFDKIGIHIRLTCPYDGSTKVTSIE